MKRRHWVPPEIIQLKNNILSTDKKTLSRRLRRYVFIYKEFGPPVDMLLVGGIPSMFAINELKSAFFNGLDMATILLAQSFIEHSLGGSFIMIGEDKVAESGFSELIDNALHKGQISKKLAVKLHELRKIRNPYTHPKSGLSLRSYMGHLMHRKKYLLPECLAERDAKRAIKIVVDFIRNGSPNWHP
jgi:hypothetical protein